VAEHRARLAGSAMTSNVPCPMCFGRGYLIGGDEEVPCPTCALRAHWTEVDRQAADIKPDWSAYDGLSPLEALHADGDR
jgi:hypothetical protein